MRVLQLLDRRETAWIAVVVVPVLMVAFDPTVFRRTTFAFGPAIYGVFRPFSYVAIAIGVLAMTMLLITGRGRALSAGMFAGGALFALALGLALLPFSLLGSLLLGLGLLGLTPFLTSLVLARWAYTTFHAATASSRAVLFALGLFVFVGVATGAQYGARSAFDISLDQMAASDVRHDEAVGRLQRWQWLLDLDQFVPVWQAEKDDVRKRRLAAAFEQLTGQNIEDRARALAD